MTYLLNNNGGSQRAEEHAGDMAVHLDLAHDALHGGI
jgi:hypothetical protein